MLHTPLRLPALATLAATLAVGAAPSYALSDTAKAAAVAGAVAARKPIAKAVKKAFETPLPPAPQAQVDAAERVYYGLYECEFNQAVDIGINPKYPAYVDVRHGKAVYVMKPVLSSTGAIRLEDVKGATLMVQIANKSMLLDTKVGRRIVDDCVSPKHRELMEAARQSKAAEMAAMAASGIAPPPPGPGLFSGPTLTASPAASSAAK